MATVNALNFQRNMVQFTVAPSKFKESQFEVSADGVRIGYAFQYAEVRDRWFGEWYSTDSWHRCETSDPFANIEQAAEWVYIFDRYYRLHWFNSMAAYGHVIKVMVNSGLFGIQDAIYPQVLCGVPFVANGKWNLFCYKQSVDNAYTHVSEHDDSDLAKTAFDQCCDSAGDGSILIALFSPSGSLDEVYRSRNAKPPRRMTATEVLSMLNLADEEQAR